MVGSINTTILIVIVGKRGGTEINNSVRINKYEKGERGVSNADLGLVVGVFMETNDSTEALYKTNNKQQG